MKLEHFGPNLLQNERIAEHIIGDQACCKMNAQQSTSLETELIAK